MQEEKIQKKMRRRSLASLKEYSITFKSKRGKKILWDLMKYSGFLQSPSDGIDSNDVIFKEGQRDVVRYILSKMKTDYEQLEKMIDGGLDDDRDDWL